MKKALLWCLLLVIVCVSCNQNVDDGPKPQHLHSYSVKYDGHLQCSSCGETVNDDYVAYVESNGNVRSYSIISGSGSTDPAVSYRDGVVSFKCSSNVSKDCHVVIYTSGCDELEVSAPNTLVVHYGRVGVVRLLDISDGSYQELGSVTESLSTSGGRIEIGSNVPKIIVDATERTTVFIDDGCTVDTIESSSRTTSSVLPILAVEGEGKVSQILSGVPLEVEVDVAQIKVSSSNCSSITVEDGASVGTIEVPMAPEGCFSPENKLHVESKDGSSIDGISIDTDSLDLVSSQPHVHILGSFVEAKEATCLESGWSRYSACQVCGYSSYHEIPALGHAIETHPAKDATCTDIGWYEYENCTRCTYTTYNEIPAKGHAFSLEWSCDTSSHWHASTCGHVDVVDGKGDHSWNEENVCSICGTRNEGSGVVVIDPCEYKLSLEFPDEWGGSLVVVPNVSATLRAVLKPERDDASYVFFVDGEIFETQDRPELVLGTGEGEVSLDSGLHVITVIVLFDGTSYSESYKLDVKEGGCGVADSAAREV